MRSAGVGDGKGVGVGEGVWAMVGSDSLEVAKPYSKSGQDSTNNVVETCFGSRLLDSVFPFASFLFSRRPPSKTFAVSQRSCSSACTLHALFSILDFTTLAFPNR
jgi:hypothetical protein